MKEKIGAEFEPDFILGACNPNLAHQALSADRAIGLLLPCNVVLRQFDEGIEVSILDPEVMFSVVAPETSRLIHNLPQDARQRLQAVLADLGQS